VLDPDDAANKRTYAGTMTVPRRIPDEWEAREEQRAQLDFTCPTLTGPTFSVAVGRGQACRLSRSPATSRRSRGNCAPPAADMARAYAVHATTRAAGVARRAVITGGLRDRSALTRRVATSGAVDVRAARQAGGLVVAELDVGGARSVNAGGRPSAGQVIFGAEWAASAACGPPCGPARRARAGAAALRRGYVQFRDRPRLGVSVADQEAVYRAGGTRTRRTTSQFRPWRKHGYWMTPALERAQPALVEAWSAALERRGRRMGPAWVASPGAPVPSCCAMSPTCATTYKAPSRPAPPRPSRSARPSGSPAPSTSSTRLTPRAGRGAKRAARETSSRFDTISEEANSTASKTLASFDGKLRQHHRRLPRGRRAGRAYQMRNVAGGIALAAGAAGVGLLYGALAEVPRRPARGRGARRRPHREVPRRLGGVIDEQTAKEQARARIEEPATGHATRPQAHRRAGRERPHRLRASPPRS